MNYYRNIVPAFRQATRFLVGTAIGIMFVTGLISGVIAWISLFAYMLGLEFIPLRVTMMLFIAVVIQSLLVIILADKAPMKFSDIIREAELEKIALKGTLAYIGIIIPIGIKVFIFP